jgi:hypothetical protein
VVERRHERSRGGYWWNIGDAGSSLASSAQLKGPEMRDFAVSEYISLAFV